MCNNIIEYLSGYRSIVNLKRCLGCMVYIPLVLYGARNGVGIYTLAWPRRVQVELSYKSLSYHVLEARRILAFRCFYLSSIAYGLAFGGCTVQPRPKLATITAGQPTQVTTHRGFGKP